MARVRAVSGVGGSCEISLAFTDPRLRPVREALEGVPFPAGGVLVIPQGSGCGVEDVVDRRGMLRVCVEAAFLEMPPARQRALIALRLCMDQAIHRPVVWRGRPVPLLRHGYRGLGSFGDARFFERVVDRVVARGVSLEDLGPAVSWMERRLQVAVDLLAIDRQVMPAIERPASSLLLTSGAWLDATARVEGILRGRGIGPTGPPAMGAEELERPFLYAVQGDRELLRRLLYRGKDLEVVDTLRDRRTGRVLTTCRETVSGRQLRVLGLPSPRPGGG